MNSAWAQGTGEMQVGGKTGKDYRFEIRTETNFECKKIRLGEKSLKIGKV